MGSKNECVEMFLSIWKKNHQVIQLTIITNYDTEKKEAHKMSTLINIYWSNDKVTSCVVWVFSVWKQTKLQEFKTHQLIETKLNKL